LKVKLINQPNEHYSALYQVLYNRGIININKYLETNDKNINQPELLGEELLKRGAKMLIQHISNKDPILVIVDADCDGYTSSALLLNYLYDLFPEYTKEKIDYYLHLKKQHGLSDCIKECFKYKMILLPDASSNDASYHEELAAAGIDVLVLDHHDAEVDPSAYQNACIINNQLSEYPNKELSGVGVTWQFCRYLDKILNKDYANNYLDLVALGDSADMMDARSLETKALLFKGFKEENLKNPFIVNMIEKNNFSLNKADYKPSSNNELEITPMGASFFITPFVNAITRSGEIEEKDIVFTSMLKYKAFEEIPSTKRGHKLGEKERVIDQALRVCTNV
jgi:single-stranded-DNA-specific exonuclease